MLEFFKCNCANFITSSEQPTVDIRVDNINILTKEINILISLELEMEILLQGTHLERETDFLYLANLRDTIKPTYTELIKDFIVPLQNVDDSSQQIYTNLMAEILPGNYKVLFLRINGKIQMPNQDGFLRGNWILLGQSELLKLEFLTEDEIRVNSPYINKTSTLESPQKHQMKDITNIQMDLRPKFYQFGDFAPGVKSGHKSSRSKPIYG